MKLDGVCAKYILPAPHALRDTHTQTQTHANVQSRAGSKHASDHLARRSSGSTLGAAATNNEGGIGAARRQQQQQSQRSRPWVEQTGPLQKQVEVQPVTVAVSHVRLQLAKAAARAAAHHCERSFLQVQNLRSRQREGWMTRVRVGQGRVGQGRVGQGRVGLWMRWRLQRVRVKAAGNIGDENTTRSKSMSGISSKTI